MYADVMTDSMKIAIEETNRRRGIQQAYNEKYGITPATIIKPIEEAIRGKETKAMAAKYLKKKAKLGKVDRENMIAGLEKDMKQAARVLDFERAAELRDMVFELKSED